nr:phosphoenolpyruvate mutase [Pseudomonadota bacterium]
LHRARQALDGDAVILYGDLLFRRYVLGDLLDAPGDIVAVVDSALPAADSPDYRDLAFCSAADDRALFRQDVNLLRVAPGGDPDCGRPDGRWLGMLRVRGVGRTQLLAALDGLAAQPDFAVLGMPELLNRLIGDGAAVKVHYIHGHWLDVNRLEDLSRAGDFAHGHPAAGFREP